MAASDRRVRMRARMVLAVVGLLFLSACKVEFDVGAEVEEDGSGRLAVTALLGETARETLSEGGLITNDPEEIRRLLDQGMRPSDLRAEDGPNPVDVLEETVPDEWHHERVTEGKIQGLRLTADFSDVEEIPALLEPFDDWGDELAARLQGRDAEDVGVAAVVRGFSVEREASIFRFRGEPNLEPYEGATGGPNKLLAEFTISVKLPGGVREHDADEEEDGALVWHIAPGTSRSISATSDLTYNPRDFPTVPVAVGASVAGLAGLLALRHLRERRRGGGGPPGPDVPDSEPVPV